MKGKIFKKIFSIMLIIILVCGSFYYIYVKDYAILNGYHDSEEHWDPHGFQDYTDYCKYYYKDKFDKKFSNSFLYKKVEQEDIENITSYFMNFEKWMEIEERMDIYDFDTNIISEGDFVRIETKEYGDGDPKWKFANYTIYLYDIESNILYYIHSNI